VWNAEKGFATHSFRDHKAMVIRVLFGVGSRLEARSVATCARSGGDRPRAAQVLSCADDGQVRLWNLETSQPRDLVNHLRC
jgi:hypothetical protein